MSEQTDKPGKRFPVQPGNVEMRTDYHACEVLERRGFKLRKVEYPGNTQWQLEMRGLILFGVVYCPMCGEKVEAKQD